MLMSRRYEHWVCGCGACKMRLGARVETCLAGTLTQIPPFHSVKIMKQMSM